jgi:hypothetical protein
MEAHVKLNEKRMDLDHQGEQHDQDLHHQAQEGEKQRQHEKSMPKANGHAKE